MLCSATIFDRPLEDKIAHRRGGFKAITVWPHDYTSAKARGRDDAAMRRMLDDHGVSVDGVDCLLDWLPGDQVPDMPVFRAQEDDLHRVADALGGRFINVAQAFGSTVDVAQATDLFAGICERASRRKLLVTLEPVPWAGIGSLRTARAIVAGSRAQNARIAIDTWGFFRGGSRIDDLAKPGVRSTTRAQMGRSAPGLGGPDCRGLGSLDAGRRRITCRRGDCGIDTKGFDGPWGIEAPSALWKDLSGEEIGRRCGAAMRRSLTQ